MTVNGIQKAVRRYNEKRGKLRSIHAFSILLPKLYNKRRNPLKLKQLLGQDVKLQTSM